MYFPSEHLKEARNNSDLTVMNKSFKPLKHALKSRMRVSQ